MGHRRIPVIPGQLSPPLTLTGTSGAWPHTTAPPAPAPDDADKEEIEPENDTRSDLPGDFVKGPRGRR